MKKISSLRFFLSQRHQRVYWIEPILVLLDLELVGSLDVGAQRWFWSFSILYPKSFEKRNFSPRKSQQKKTNPQRWLNRVLFFFVFCQFLSIQKIEFSHSRITLTEEFTLNELFQMWYRYWNSGHAIRSGISPWKICRFFITDVCLRWFGTLKWDFFFTMNRRFFNVDITVPYELFFW